MLDVNAIIYGVIYLFYEPNAADPLNREAADLFRADKPQVIQAIYLLVLFSRYIDLYHMYSNTCIVCVV